MVPLVTILVGGKTCSDLMSGAGLELAASAESDCVGPQRVAQSRRQSQQGPPAREPAVVPLVWGRGLRRSCLCSFPGCSSFSMGSTLRLVFSASRSQHRQLFQEQQITLP